MHMHHNRTVTISKAKLIEKIKENKELHIKEYVEAVKIYIDVANKQLKQATENLNSGKLKIVINLTVPIDRSSEYDKIIEMFNWEVKEEIELTQSEFNEYVHDDNVSANNAKLSNAFYSSSF